MSDESLVLEDIETRPGLLLVDDEKNVLSSLKRLFRKTDCDVFIANSGQEGLEILKEHAIDVIVSDARMPEMSGPEFLAIAAEQYPDAKRILLTGYADMQAIVDAVNLGKVSHYLEKPWDDEQLQKLVNDAFVTINLMKQNARLQSLIEQKNKKLTVMMIETRRYIACHFNMLNLVAPDRHLVGVEHQNISSHQHWVRKQSRVYIF